MVWEDRVRRLENKTAFLTAAGAGIGRATALAFAREGARVIATDKDAAALATLTRELGAISGAHHEAFTLDVLDGSALEAAANAHRDVNVLFNCAGWVHQGTLASTAIHDWQRSFDLNVTPMFVLTKAFLPHFIANGGASIINVASLASSLKGIPNRAAYTASKAAVIGLSKSIAMDYIQQGIRVNTICPGTVDSPSLHERAASTGDQKAALAAFVARQPIGRLGTPEEIAAIAVYLAGDESGYTTGTDIIVDGGIRL
jgi:NAD(P)-dependent dehydrogenase (short-subunit alcohol dehydrogenase family)